MFVRSHFASHENGDSRHFHAKGEGEHMEHKKYNIVKYNNTWAPNDGFLLNVLKTLASLSRVLSDL